MTPEPVVVRGLPGHLYAATRTSARHRPLHLARCWCWHADPVWPTVRVRRWRLWSR